MTADGHGDHESLRRRLTEAEGHFARRFGEMFEELTGRLGSFDTHEARRVFESVLDLTEARRLVHDLRGLVREEPAYLISSLFLREMYGALVADENEELYYVTGPEQGPVRVPSRLVPFAKRKRTPVCVEGDDLSSHRTLLALERAGHPLLAWAHSHPGVGAGATCPSGIDRAHQERLEQGGYRAVGAIVSRDGYVRFFTNGRPARVEIFGKGMERLDEGLYRLRDD